MNINVPSRVQNQMQNFRTKGSFGEGSQREVLDETVIGGASFVLAIQAQTLTGADEVSGQDEALGQPGIVKLSPESVDGLKELYPGITSGSASFDPQADPENRTITAQFEKDGLTYFNEISTSPGVISSAAVAETTDGYQFEGIYINQNDGSAWEENYIIAK